VVDVVATAITMMDKHPHLLLRVVLLVLFGIATMAHKETHTGVPLVFVFAPFGVDVDVDVDVGDAVVRVAVPYYPLFLSQSTASMLILLLYFTIM